MLGTNSPEKRKYGVNGLAGTATNCAHMDLHDQMFARLEDYLQRSVTIVERAILLQDIFEEMWGNWKWKKAREVYDARHDRTENNS